MEPMRHVNVSGFGGQGITLDVPFSLRNLQQLQEGRNIRLQDGMLSTIPKNNVAISLQPDPVYACPYYTYDETGGHIICYLNGNIDYIDATGAILDITPDTPPTDNGGYWYSTQLNDILVLTNGLNVPYQITQTDLQASGKLTEMVNWPANYRARIFEPLKGYLVASGLTVDGFQRRALVKWAHPLAPGETDFLWDHLDDTLLTGENELAVSGRDIRAMQPLRDNMLIYFDQAVWGMSEVGGGFVFGFRQVFKDDGCVGPEAWCEVDGQALVVGFRDIYKTDGFNRTSLSDGKIGRWFYRHAAITDDIEVSYYPDRQEVFILHKTSENYREHNRALIYNVLSNAFTVMTLPGVDNLGGATRLYQGGQFNGTDMKWSSFEDDVEFWSNTSGSWASMQENDQKLYHLLLNRGGQQLEVMDQESNTPHEGGNIYIETRLCPLWDLFPTAGDKIKFITRIYPRMTGTGRVKFAVGVAEFANGPVEWKPWVGFQLGDSPDGEDLKDYAVDVRAAGRFIGIRVSMGYRHWAMFQLEGFDMEIGIPDMGRR